MPSLPPPVWAELFFDSTWNPISRDVRMEPAITVTRGLSSESAAEAEPTSSELTLDSRSHKYSPRNVRSDLYNKIGRNTPLRWGYKVGPPWAEMSGTNGNEITTPTSAAYNVTDLDLRLDLSLDDWEVSQGIAARFTASGNNRSWAVYMAGTGQVGFTWSPTGTSTTLTQFSTVPLKAYNGQRLTLRITMDVNDGAGGYELRFYTGRTVDDDEWVLLGDPIVGVGTTALFAASSIIEFGDVLGLVIAGMTGKVFALKLMSAILGTAVLTMTTADAAPGVTSFTSNGAVWTTTTGAKLTNKHIRMAGEIPAWPPTRDLSGNDTVVNIAPTGVTRRMDAGSKPQDSTILRYIKANNPVECWPLTDGPASTSFKSLVGGADMTQRIIIGTDTAVGKGQGSLADWIEPVLSAKANTTAQIIGRMRRTSGTDAAWAFDVFLAGGGPLSVGTFNFKDRGRGDDADNRINIQLIMTGSLDRISVLRNSEGETSSSVALLQNIDNVGIYNDDPHHIRIAIDPGATDTGWELFVDGTSRGSGTISSIVVKSLSTMDLAWGFASGDGMTDRSFGYFSYWPGTGPTAAQIYDAYTGFQGERAGDRIERLADEAGYVASTSGETAFQERVGIQDRKKLLELLNQANQTNFGYFLERRDGLELIHRSHSTLWNQPPALTLDFSAGIITAPFRPTDDDKLTENDVSVKRAYGSVAARYTLDSGRLSTLDFPNGVGRYDNAYEYSLYTDDQAGDTAYMRLHLGTYDGVRYARITLDLANERVFQMIGDILRADVGDKIKLVNVPEDHGPDDVEVLIQGYTEEAGPSSWKITFNCIPAEPWNAFVASSDRYSRADTNGSSMNSSATSTATSLSVKTASGNTVWVDSTGYAAEFPFDVRINSGEVVRVTAISGTTSPQTFTVVRGVNGVSVAHVADEDVRLAYPVYIPL